MEFRETRRQGVQDITLLRSSCMKEYCLELLELPVFMSPYSSHPNVLL
jgi:hypothetical protein